MSMLARSLGIEGAARMNAGDLKHALTTGLGLAHAPISEWCDAIREKLHV